jgi:hypothetical protein
MSGYFDEFKSAGPSSGNGYFDDVKTSSSSSKDQAQGQGQGYFDFGSKDVASYTDPPLVASGYLSSPADSPIQPEDSIPPPTYLEASIQDRFPRAFEPWQTQFEQALQMSCDNAEVRLQRAVQIRKLVSDFSEVALSVGQVIIEEMRLPKKQKTIFPLSGKGIAGGEKFRVGQMFFKLVRDVFGIYGGDAFAVKAAKHEVKSLKALVEASASLQANSLFFPIMCTVDHLGIQLVCMSYIEGIGKNTLIYGSDDAGKSIHNQDFVFNRYFKQICESLLNIAPHNVYDPTASAFKMIWAASDVEGHKVETDQGSKYYLLDFARLFPPEDPETVPGQRFRALWYDFDEKSTAKPEYFMNWPDEAVQKLRQASESAVEPPTAEEYEFCQLRTSEGFILFNKKSTLPVNSRLKELFKIENIRGPAVILQNKGSIFINLNRPEHLKSLTSDLQKIAGDAFCGFGFCVDCVERDFCFHGANAKHLGIKASSSSLLHNTVKQFAYNWESRIISPADALELVQLMHKDGINVRWLGFLRDCLLEGKAENKHRRLLILLEMIARTSKRMLFQRLRIAQQYCADGSSNAIILECRKSLIDFMNLMFGNSPNSLGFWEELRSLLSIFFPSYSRSQETGEKLLNETSSCKFQLLLRFLEQTGVKVEVAKIHSLSVESDLWDSENIFSLDDVPR